MKTITYKIVLSILIMAAGYAVIWFWSVKDTPSIPKEPAITKADLQVVKDAGYIEVARLEAQVRAMAKRIEVLEIRKPVEVPYCDCPVSLCDCGDWKKVIEDLHPDLLKEEYR